MIRITRPDGTVYECETERDFQIVSRAFVNGHASPQPVPDASGSAHTNASSTQTLDEGPRKLLSALLGGPGIDSEALRDRVGMESQELGRQMLLLSNALDQITGKRLDEYVTRRRTFRNGQRVKLYQRTKAGEKLLRETKLV